MNLLGSFRIGFNTLKMFVLALLESQIKSHVKIFPKVQHGWTVRYNAEDEAAVKCAEEAHQDILDWFLSHLK